MSGSSKYCFRYSDTSLYKMCRFGVNPRFLNFMGFFIPFSMHGPVLFLGDVVRILFAS